MMTIQQHLKLEITSDFEDLLDEGLSMNDALDELEDEYNDMINTILNSLYHERR